MAYKTEVAERDEWSYSPAVGVGPLRFGMSIDAVVEAAEILGQTKVRDCARDHAIFSQTWEPTSPRSGGPPAMADRRHHR
jgi:hypothetical protein